MIALEGRFLLWLIHINKYIFQSIKRTGLTNAWLVICGLNLLTIWAFLPSVSVIPPKTLKDCARKKKWQDDGENPLCFIQNQRSQKTLRRRTSLLRSRHFNGKLTVGGEFWRRVTSFELKQIKTCFYVPLIGFQQTHLWDGGCHRNCLYHTSCSHTLVL